MLTSGGESSLWRSLDSGNTWARTFTSALANVDSVKLVDLPPEYGDNNQKVFIAGEGDGKPAIWKSVDNSQEFRCQFTHDPIAHTTFPINTWAIVDDTTLFIGSYDGNDGLVYLTSNSGFIYSEGAMRVTRRLTP